MLDFKYGNMNFNIYDGWISNGKEVDENGKCHQLANFGVETEYTIYITNTSNNDKELKYNVSTATNYLAQISCEKVINADSKNYYNLVGEVYNTPFTLIGRGECHYINRSGDDTQYTGNLDIAKICIPANTRVKVILRVISPTNVRGCLGSKLTISNVS